jgi:hypothetical protein
MVADGSDRPGGPDSGREDLRLREGAESFRTGPFDTIELLKRASDVGLAYSQIAFDRTARVPELEDCGLMLFVGSNLHRWDWVDDAPTTTTGGRLEGRRRVFGHGGGRQL